MTPTTKPVQRVSHSDTIYDRGKRRKIVVRIGPGDVVSFRLIGLRDGFTDGLALKELYVRAVNRTVTRKYLERCKSAEAAGKKKPKKPVMLPL